MWTCKKCNEKIEDNSDECWNCFQDDNPTENNPIENDNLNGTFPKSNNLEKGSDSNNGCLINILSVVAGALGLTIGVALQLLLFDKSGAEEIGGGLVIGLTFGTYYFTKKHLKKYFENKTKP